MFLGGFARLRTCKGACVGLLSGTLAAALHHGLTLPIVALPGVKGGWLATVASYPSEMAQNFWTAIDAWVVCFVVTIAVSLVTRPRPDAELRGLVYSLTERPRDERLAWYLRPAILGSIVLAAVFMLNVVFF